MKEGNFDTRFFIDKETIRFQISKSGRSARKRNVMYSARLILSYISLLGGNRSRFLFEYPKHEIFFSLRQLKLAKSFVMILRLSFSALSKSSTINSNGCSGFLYSTDFENIQKDVLQQKNERKTHQISLVKFHYLCITPYPPFGIVLCFWER